MTQQPKLADGLRGCGTLPPMNGEPHVRAAGTARDATKPKGKADRRPNGNRFALLNAFCDFTASKLSRSELLVWFTLYRDTRDGTARTGQADIARRAGLGERTVRWALGRLERRGLLIVVYRGGLSRGPSSYRLQPLEKPPEKPPD